MLALVTTYLATLCGDFDVAAPQVHFPWHPDYLDMSHILAVVHPRYLQHHMHK